MLKLQNIFTLTFILNDGNTTIIFTEQGRIDDSPGINTSAKQS